MNDKHQSFDVVFEPGEGLRPRIPAQPSQDQPSHAGVRIRVEKEEGWFVRKPGKKHKARKKPRPAAPKRKKRPSPKKKR